MDQAPPLPRRIAWVAPWTWSLWTRWGLVAAVTAAYVDLPVIWALTCYVADPVLPRSLTRAMHVVIRPHGDAAAHFTIVHQFYSIQLELLGRMVSWWAGTTSN